NARIVWDVNSTLDLDFSGSMSKTTGGAINFNASFALPSFESLFVQPAFNADVNQHDFIFAFNVPGENEQETTDFSVKADWDLSGYDVTVFASYSDLEEYLLSDGTSATFYGYELTAQCQADRLTLNNFPVADGGAGRTDLFGDFFAPFGVFPTGPGFDTWANFAGVYGPYTPTSCDGYQYQERNQTDTSFEIRLTSDADSEYRWIAGMYFADIERNAVVAYGADTGQGFLRQPYIDPTGPNPTDLLFDDNFDTTVTSIFGQTEIDLEDDLELSLALRYDREERSVSNNVPNVTASGLNINTYVGGVLGPINPAFVAFPNGIPDRDLSFSQLQPQVSLAWKANENVNLYASYGVGFRSGGFNSIGTEALLNFWFNASGTGTPGDAVDAQLQVTDDYDKEVTKSLEFGVKSTLMDNRLRLNAAVFSNTVEDNQFFEFFAGPFGILRAVTTIDEVEIQGFEMDFNAKVTDNFSLFGGVGLLSSEIIKNNNRPLSEGNDAPQAADKSINLGGQFQSEVGSDMFLVTRFDWQHVGEMWFHTLQGEQTPTIWDFFGTLGGGVPPGPHPVDFSQSKRDAYSTLNMRISLEMENTTISLWGKNITDEAYLQEVIPAPEFGGSFVHPSALSSYGVEFKYQF
ncbi:MAG: TonB-dependent receptor, partial [Gammaproteobacteria bacterium]|nr:TonB-dependent receptor [Gammaproteobacteria bacterium]